MNSIYIVYIFFFMVLFELCFNLVLCQVNTNSKLLMTFFSEIMSLHLQTELFTDIISDEFFEN